MVQCATMSCRTSGWECGPWSCRTASGTTLRWRSCPRPPAPHLVRPAQRDGLEHGRDLVVAPAGPNHEPRVRLHRGYVLGRGFAHELVGGYGDIDAPRTLRLPREEEPPPRETARLAPRAMPAMCKVPRDRSVDSAKKPDAMRRFGGGRAAAPYGFALAPADTQPRRRCEANSRRVRRRPR